jgi:hypothetical protein
VLVGAGVGQKRTPEDSTVQAWPNGWARLAAAAEAVANTAATHSTHDQNQRFLILDISRNLPLDYDPNAGADEQAAVRRGTITRRCTRIKVLVHI